MELLENISEYYDELFPVTDEQKQFFEKELESFNKPAKLLSISCGSGLFEHILAEKGTAVTAIETIHSLLESANRRRRTQLMTINYFNMTNLEMGRFLGKGFYNIVTILNDRIMFTSDPILMDKLFYDCKQLLAKNGKFIISLPNFEKYKSNIFELPVKESIRVKLFSKVITNMSGEKYLEQDLETGNGRFLPVTRDAKIFPLTREKIQECAKKAGFSKVEFKSSFVDTDNNSDSIIAIIS